MHTQKNTTYTRKGAIWGNGGDWREEEQMDIKRQIGGSKMIYMCANLTLKPISL